MSSNNEMIFTKCQLCDKDDNNFVYTRVIETGPILGKIEIKNVICNNCGFMYNNPRPSPEALGRFYTDEISASSNVFRTMEEGSRQNINTKEQVEFIRKNIQKKNPGKLLEVGCRNGGLLVNLRLRDWELWGLEPSRVAEAALKSGINVIFGTLENTELEEKKYDLIICSHVLEHMYDPNIIKKMVSALKLDGNIMIEVPDSTKPVAQIGEYFSHEHLNHFTFGTLQYLLAKYDV